MNKIVLKHTGTLQINGTDIDFVSGFRVKANGDGLTTVTVQFDVNSIDVEVSSEDFRLNNLPLGSESILIPEDGS